MSPNCSFLEFLAYILEKSSKFGIFSSQNETEIMFFEDQLAFLVLYLQFGMCSIESNHIWHLGTWNPPFSVISNLRPILLIFWLPKMTIAINRPYFLERNQSGQKRMRICIRFTENTKKTVSKTLWKWRKCARFEALCPPLPPLQSLYWTS